MSLLSELIFNKIENNKKLGLYRKIPEIAYEDFNLKTCQDKNTNGRFINYSTATANLATNDYLGFAKNKKIKKATKKAIDVYGTSASSSFLIYGHSEIHLALEKELCDFKGGYEKSLLYPSGYQANTGIIKSLSSILPLKTFIAFDELSHASIIDGVLASGVKFKSFKHNDLNCLENILDKHKNYEIKLVITEGVFSMDGDVPDLPGILNIAKLHGALSIVDDAHATGTIGEKGGGSADFHKVKPDIIIGTLGKALASNGAFAVSSSLIIEYLINFSRTFIFSTGIPPSSAASALEALKLIKDNPKIVKKLQDYSKFARDYLKKSGLNTLNSTTHIIPIFIGEEDKAVSVEKELLKMGIYLKAVRYPTVQRKNARLRLGVNAKLKKETLKKALKDIAHNVKFYSCV